MYTDFFKGQYDALMHQDKHTLKQFFYCKIVSFNYFPLSNYKNLICQIDKVVQGD